MKDTEMRFHHIRELVMEKKLEVWNVDIEVNILTKPLLEQHFRPLRNTMRL